MQTIITADNNGALLYTIYDHNGTREAETITNGTGICRTCLKFGYVNKLRKNGQCDQCGCYADVAHLCHHDDMHPHVHYYDYKCDAKWHKAEWRQVRQKIMRNMALRVISVTLAIVAMILSGIYLFCDPRNFLLLALSYGFSFSALVLSFIVIPRYGKNIKQLRSQYEDLDYDRRLNDRSGC